MSFDIASSSLENFDARLDTVLDRTASKFLERLISLIKENAHVESELQPLGNLSGYYSDSRMPVFTREMLDSITEVKKLGNGQYQFSITAPYTSDIEDGNPHVPFGDPKWELWQNLRARVNLKKDVIVGQPHPFIKPRLEELLEELPGMFANELEFEFGR